MEYEPEERPSADETRAWLEVGAHAKRLPCGPAEVQSADPPICIFRFALSTDKCHVFRPLPAALHQCAVQELLTELPHDTCPIPEPLDIPDIPDTDEATDRGTEVTEATDDDVGTPPLSGLRSADQYESGASQDTLEDGGSKHEARAHARRDRSLGLDLQPGRQRPSAAACHVLSCCHNSGFGRW